MEVAFVRARQAWPMIVGLAVYASLLRHASVWKLGLAIIVVLMLAALVLAIGLIISFNLGKFRLGNSMPVPTRPLVFATPAAWDSTTTRHSWSLTEHSANSFCTPLHPSGTARYSAPHQLTHGARLETSCS